ncbi:MAG TPA: type I phosphomannose isomerase catalytic subunit [Chloroflexia bacterium]|nr:type I phosphomannose isomerase catalytic subunit [Chloroflexia bacterium]
MDLYPLRLEPQVKEIVWGGRWLAEVLGRPGKPDAPLGESWEAYSKSLINNGSLNGRQLNELFDEYGGAFFGTAAMNYPKFPLLVKFIDAKDNLSVQVHPDNALAQELENYPLGKTEFWYVMAAEPGAEICYGLNDSATSREQLGQALAEKDLLRYLQRSPVKAGDVVYIPAGTVHALTKGIVVYELQQDSDITYRLYDWGRVGREIHIEKGLKAINLEYHNMQVTHPELKADNGYARAQLIESPFFQSELLRIDREASLKASPDSFMLLSVIEGQGQLNDPRGKWESEALRKGDTLLIPASLEFKLVSEQHGEPLEVISGWLVK